MARNIARDYAEIVAFAQQFVGKRAIDCIQAYARKRKIVDRRAGKAFWAKNDGGYIQTLVDADGFEVIAGVELERE
jgi:hypothetical protein